LDLSEGALRARLFERLVRSTLHAKSRASNRVFAHALGRLLHQLSQELEGVKAKCFRDIEILDHIEATLAALKLGNVGLRSVEAFCQLPLGQARAFPRLSEKLAESGVSGREN
jgi:hypothetical protein